MNGKPQPSQLPMRTPPPAALADARYPFMPFGIVPLVGLLVLAIVALVPFAFGEVQAVTEASARKALQEAGIGWARASASGQWIILEGRPESREEAQKAVAAVSGAQADTLFGRAAPVTWVIEHFTWAEDQLRPGDILRPRDGSEGSPDIAAMPPPTEAEAACDRSMSDLLASTHIQFPTGSSDIGAGSVGLLRSIAQAAAACPGTLRIEGYTDGVGRDADNVALSRRRAEAVRTALIVRGVAPERLVAEGFGDARPLADNDTADGRARNRRIEIRSVRSPPT